MPGLPRITRRPRVVSLAIAFFVGLLAPSMALAEVTPPSVLDAVEAEYPAAALEANRGEVVVPLRIVIEADGTISEATVVDARGDGLDEAAVAAMLQYRFEPARRDGTPIRVAVRFDFVVRPPEPEEDVVPEPTEEPPPEEPPAPPPGRVVGQLLDAVAATGLDEVDVLLTDESGAVRATRTDAEGRFAFDEVAPGTYQLAMRPLGLPERVETETVVSGEELALTYRFQTEIEAEAADTDIGATAVVDPPPREAARRTLPAEVLNTVAGTRGDPLRAIEILPGIARPPFGIGLVIVRGSAPGDTEILLDGVPIPLLYHFGGLTSVFNGRLLDRVDFYPGNFSSRYGRKMGGIIEVDTRDPRTDRIHGNVELSVIDGSVMIEGPLTPKFAIAASVRRSFIDSFFGLIAPDRLGVTTAPVYYDYQLLGTYRPTERDRVRFRFYGSDDRLRLFLGNGFSDDPAARGAAGLATRFNFLQANWVRQMNPRTQQMLVFQTGPTALRFSFGRAARFELRAMNLFGRAEWTSNLNEHLRIVGGVDFSSAAVDINYTGGPVGSSEGNPPDQSQGTVSLSENVFNVRPGAYVDLAITQGNFILNTALRFDYYSEINRVTVDPRLVANYRIDDHWKIRAGAGLYSQPPEFQESAAILGNPNLEPIHSAHFSLGTDWTPGTGISLGLDGFYKQLWNRVIQTPMGEPPTFVNGGVGRIYGMELSARVPPTDTRPYYGYVSYTLMRSERRDQPGTDWRFFDYDQTHIFTGSFMYRFRRHHWELGGTVRLVSGNPYTPVVGRTFDPVAQNYYPINGLTNSARNPLFNRFDIRVEKQWWFDAWKLCLFLDVQNATNRRNQEAVLYNFDYTETAGVNGLPIIPAIGLRGEF